MGILSKTWELLSSPKNLQLISGPNSRVTQHRKHHYGIGAHKMYVAVAMDMLAVVGMDACQIT